ncbi:MAG: hypothetical protein KJO21_10670 [Verrucomicrobiae bacterium]|nr:hypothetical protein [Verrucomicrobiae bacterium]NNJ42747.1 hypothetical protein [Akkermansiaceae bacterium]
MPVNGLLLTLTEDEELAGESLLEISRRDDIELGDRTDRWQPVVVETEGTRESHEAHEWLADLPGVQMVDVVFTSVSRPPQEASSKKVLK